MEANKIEKTIQNQIAAFKKFQKIYNFDLTFPIMDLDEYVDIISNIEGKEKKIKKSKDYAKFSPEEILKIPREEKIMQSSTFQVLKGIRIGKDKSINYIGGYIPGPYTLVSLVLELQVASELMIFEPEFLKSLILFSNDIIKQYAKLIHKFVDTIFILAPSECTIMKQSYIQYVQESMNNIIKYCVSDLKKPSLIHFCSKKTAQVVNEDIIGPMKKAGIHGLNIPNIVQNLDLARKYDLIFCGGIDPVNIQLQPTEKILQQLEEVFKSIQDIRYIFGTNCQVKWAPGQIESEDLLDIFKKLIEFKNSHF